MRRRALRTRDLLVFILLVALVLAWNRRREQLLGFAETHREWQSRENMIGMVRYPRKGDPHFECCHPDRKWERWAAHKRAAEVYEASAWCPWISVPEDVVRLTKDGDQPIGPLHLP